MRRVTGPAFISAGVGIATGHGRVAAPLVCGRPLMLAPGVQVGKPKTSIKKDAKKLNEPSKSRGAGADAGSAKATPKRKTKTDEIPMYKVLLLGDDDYDENHVVTQCMKIIQLESKAAQKVFVEAQNTGEGLLTVVTEEHAEFYVLQLKREEIFARMEEDI